MFVQICVYRKIENESAKLWISGLAMTGMLSILILFLMKSFLLKEDAVLTLN